MLRTTLACPRCPGARPLAPLARRPTDPRGARLAACTGCRSLYWRRRSRDGRPELADVRMSPIAAESGH